MNKQNNNDELCKEGLHQIMMTRYNDEALRFLLQEGDPDPKHTIFVDVT